MQHEWRMVAGAETVRRHKKSHGRSDIRLIPFSRTPDGVHFHKLGERSNFQNLINLGLAIYLEMYSTFPYQWCCPISPSQHVENINQILDHTFQILWTTANCKWDCIHISSPWGCLQVSISAQFINPLFRNSSYVWATGSYAFWSGEEMLTISQHSGSPTCIISWWSNVGHIKWQCAFCQPVTHLMNHARGASLSQKDFIDWF